MRWIRVGFLVFLILLCIPRIAHAQETGEVLFYEWDENGEAIDKAEDIIFLQNSDAGTKAYVLFYALFHPLQKDKVTYVPLGAKLENISYNNGILTVSLSCPEDDYMAGEGERLFFRQMKKTAYSIQKIRGIIVELNGETIQLEDKADF
ncbi:MAG: GerMN domain-containing protein [Epulopiscium sp.]|nr:GerMN domain-containing protein [Candidatus Epulonipiscium sp.]